MYLIINICSLIIYEYGFHDSCEKDESKEEKDDDESKDVSTDYGPPIRTFFNIPNVLPIGHIGRISFEVF